MKHRRISICPDISISLDESLVREFETHYFPFTDDTVDIVTNHNMPSKERLLLKEALEETPVSVRKIENIYTDWLKKALLLVQQCQT